MKKSNLRLSPRHVLALGALALAVGAALSGCAVEPGEPVSDEEVELAPQAPNCCEKTGYYSCNGEDFEYYPLQYCGQIPTQARNACEAYCDVPCTNSGWFNGCVP